MTTDRLKARRNNNARAVRADGADYPSLTAAARALGTSPSVIHRRLKRGHPGYWYLDGLPAREKCDGPTYWEQRALALLYRGERIRAEAALLFADARRTRWL